MDSIVFGTPLGPIEVLATEKAIHSLCFTPQTVAISHKSVSAILENLQAHIVSFFRGELRACPFPLAPEGTAFQKEVWQALLTIPWGQTRTYADIARAIGRPRATRAVGGAIGRNPIPILIPCHRVIASGGGLGGYSGGLWRKEWLLALEGHSGFPLPGLAGQF